MEQNATLKNHITWHYFHRSALLYIESYEMTSYTSMYSMFETVAVQTLIAAPGLDPNNMDSQRCDFKVPCICCTMQP